MNAATPNPQEAKAEGRSPATRASGHGWGHALAAVGAILAVYLFSASRTSLWDRDEPLYARATVEMLESGNYLYPTFGGRLFAHKPILLYWLMSLPVRLLGATELACRLASVAATAASCLLTWFIGRRLFGDRAGWWAMLALASSLMLLAVGKLAITDAVLLACITAAVACFVASLTAGVRAGHLLLLAAATGLALLAKGPVGLVPLGGIAAAVLILRGRGRLGGRYLLLALLATLGGAAIFCAWGIPAHLATGGEFSRVFLGYHVLARSGRALESHGGRSWLYLLWLPYYLPVVLIGFFPWVLHLPGAASAALGGRLGGRDGRAVLLGMALPLLVVATLAATKLPHYVLPIWPALALAVGATIQAWGDGRLSERDRRWLRRGVWPFGIVGVTGGLAAMIGPWFLPVPGLAGAGTLVGAGLLAMTAAGIWAHLRRGPAASAKVLLAGMLALELAVHAAAAPAVERAKNVPDLAAAVNAAVPADAPVAVYGFYEPSLDFYLHRAVHRIRGPEAAAEALAWLAQPGDGVLVVTGRNLRKLQDDHGAVGAECLASVKTFNPAKMDWIELVALRRRRGDGRAS